MQTPKGKKRKEKRLSLETCNWKAASCQQNLSKAPKFKVSFSFFFSFLTLYFPYTQKPFLFWLLVLQKRVFFFYIVFYLQFHCFWSWLIDISIWSYVLLWFGAFSSSDTLFQKIESLDRVGILDFCLFWSYFVDQVWSVLLFLVIFMSFPGFCLRFPFLSIYWFNSLNFWSRQVYSVGFFNQMGRV